MIWFPQNEYSVVLHMGENNSRGQAPMPTGRRASIKTASSSIGNVKKVFERRIESEITRGAKNGAAGHIVGRCEKSPVRRERFPPTTPNLPYVSSSQHRPNRQVGCELGEGRGGILVCGSIRHDPRGKL